MKLKLFTPFATTKEESGNGLGLWVSRAIVEKHEGSIRLTKHGIGISGYDSLDLFATEAKRSDARRRSCRGEGDLSL